MANTKLNFEYKNLRVSTRDRASAYHVDCDIYLNGEFITAYTYNPWWLLEKDKDIKTFAGFHNNFTLKLLFMKSKEEILIKGDEPLFLHINNFFWQHWGNQLKDEKVREIRDAILKALEGKFPKEIQPDYDSVIESLALDSQVMEATFFDFCNDCGYDSDSISALETYNECCKIGRKLVKMGVFNEIQDERERIEG